MKQGSLSIAIPLLLASSLTTALPAQAQTKPAQPCDRACLSGLADKVLDSMVARSPGSLPLAKEYAATENSVPAAVTMMTAWRTATAIAGKFYIVDAVSQQLFMLVTMKEGPHETLLFGRMRVKDKLISELELYQNRSRAQGGFQYSGDVLKNMPAVWTERVTGKRLPTRAELLRQGRSQFDTSINSFPTAGGCMIMENGKVVAEHPEVAKAVAGDMGGGAPQFKPNADGSVPIPCGSPPFRPTDPKARTEIVDEVQGIVLSQAIVHGETEPYLKTTPTESAFVPAQMLEPYAKMLAEQQRSGKYTAPALRPMAATGSVVEIHRVFDGKLQGQHLLINLGAPGARSPWVGK